MLNLLCLAEKPGSFTDREPRNPSPTNLYISLVETESQKYYKQPDIANVRLFSLGSQILIAHDVPYTGDRKLSKTKLLLLGKKRCERIIECLLGFHVLSCVFLKQSFQGGYVKFRDLK